MEYWHCKYCGREWGPAFGREVGFTASAVNSHIGVCADIERISRENKCSRDAARKIRNRISRRLSKERRERERIEREAWGGVVAVINGQV